MPRSRQTYGIDTSIFVRLLTGHPEVEFERTVNALEKLLETAPGTELVVSNMVIGESYIALQHHYGIGKMDAREAILDVLNGGLILPVNGPGVLDALRQKIGCGLLDRLIVDDYVHSNCGILTHDRRMAQLPGVVRLVD